MRCSLFSVSGALLSADGSFVSISTPTLGWYGITPPGYHLLVAANAGLLVPFIDTTTTLLS